MQAMDLNSDSDDEGYDENAAITDEPASASSSSAKRANGASSSKAQKKEKANIKKKHRALNGDAAAAVAHNGQTQAALSGQYCET